MQHVRQRRTYRVAHSANVHGKGPVPRFVVHVLKQPAGGGDSGVVHQHLHRSQRGLYPAKHSLHRLRLRRVRLKRGDVVPRLPQLCHQFLRSGAALMVVDGDIAPLFRQLSDDRPPNSPASAGNQRHFSHSFAPFPRLSDSRVCFSLVLL
ncbi:hypothetical protein SDC9_74430 [bioreactor metagenome]|uniref:Uncharacterized protein n=1 Tax=bioreactor metagenome TaxID=1076179 RepID=A0A644YH61_9ZZZZ